MATTENHNKASYRPYAAEEDLFLIKHAYTGMPFSEIAETLDRTLPSVYFRRKAVFGVPLPCKKHPIFKKRCNDCLENAEDWRAKALETQSSLAYELPNQKQNYTKEEDLFVINNAFSRLSLVEIASELGRSVTSVYRRCYTLYGIPKCSEHSSFIPECSECLKAVPEWREQALKKTNKVERIIIPTSSKHSRIAIMLGDLGIGKYPSIYDDLYSFMMDTEFIGRNLEKCLFQIVKLYLNDYLRNHDFSKGICYDFIDLYVEIKSDLAFQNEFKPLMTKYFGKKYPSLNGYSTFFLMDFYGLCKHFGRKKAASLFPICGRFYKKLFHLFLIEKPGFIAGIVYEFYDQRKKRIPQWYVAEKFKVNSVTLRERITELSKMPQMEENKEEIFRALKTIERSEDEESEEQNYEEVL